MERPVVIFVSVVTVISFVIAILLFVLFIQRRRQRALLMLSIAQEEAERRRRKRKKAGLRSWEIESACPQAIVSAITQPPAGLAVYDVDEHPEEYANAVRDLKSNGLLPRDEVSESGVAVPARLVVSREGEVCGGRGRCVRSEGVSDGDGNVPCVVVSLPSSMETCVICLEDIVVGARVRSLPCSHVYHAQCIRVWLRRKNACPCCCVKVIKRRKKRPRPPYDDAMPSEPEMGTLRAGEDEESPGRSTTPTSPCPARAATDDGVMGREELLMVVGERPADRSEETVIDVMEPRSKSMSYCGDRPRKSSGAVVMQGAFPRNTSLHDLDDPGSEVFASEASSHLDEQTSAELLYQVRRALRGESSMISLNTSVDDTSEAGYCDNGLLPGNSDIDEDSFRNDSSVLRDLDWESARRRGFRNDEANQV